MDINKLDRSEKEKILAALAEKKRRELLRKPKYIPNAGQLPIHKSSARERYTFSGNGSGKTTVLVHEAKALADGINPWTGVKTKVPANIIVVLDVSRKIEERFIPEYKKWFESKPEQFLRMGKPYTSRILLDNGSVIDFYSADADPGSFEGIEASAVLIDEPVPKPLWVALKRSLRKKGHPCKLLFCGTAVDQAWLRRDIFEPWAKHELMGVECFRVGTDVNKANLEEGYIEQFSQGLSESEKEVRLKGGFFDSDSLALSHLWKRETHIVPDSYYTYDPRMPCVVAIDPHTVKPHHAVMISVDKHNRLYVIKEISLRATATQFGSALKKWSAGYNIIDWVCDSFGSAETTSFEGFASFIDKLCSPEVGLRVRATTYAEKDHEDLIDRLRSVLLIPTEPDQFGLKLPQLRVLASCTGVIADIESASFQKNRMTGEMKPKLDTSAKDFLSCLGYALATGLFYEKPRKTRPVHYKGSMYNVTPEASKRPRVKIQAMRAGYARRFR